MNEQAFFSLGEAAKLYGKSKGALSHAIKSGRLSGGERTPQGYRLSLSELIRCFGEPPANPSTDPKNEQHSTHADGGANADEAGGSKLALRVAVLEAEKAMLEGAKRTAEDQIADLRKRLDHSEEERRAKDAQVTALLKDQRQQSGGFLGMFKKKNPSSGS